MIHDLILSRRLSFIHKYLNLLKKNRQDEKSL